MDLCDLKVSDGSVVRGSLVCVQHETNRFPCIRNASAMSMCPCGSIDWHPSMPVQLSWSRMSRRSPFECTMTLTSSSWILPIISLREKTKASGDCDAAQPILPSDFVTA